MPVYLHKTDDWQEEHVHSVQASRRRGREGESTLRLTYLNRAEADHQTSIIVALREDGKDAQDDKRRFKVVFSLANKVDMETIVGFSKGEAQSAQVREETVSFQYLL